MVRVSSAAATCLPKAIVTNRFQPMNANGKTVHMIGLPWHFGWLVPKRGGDSANLLTAAVGRPQLRHTGIQGLHGQHRKDA